MSEDPKPYAVELNCQNNGCRYHDKTATKGCLMYADRCDEYNEIKGG